MAGLQLPGRPISRIRRAVARGGDDAILGGLGAAWIGGPLVGLAVTGMVNRMNKNELDRIAEDEALMREANQAMHDVIDEQERRATNPNDIAQLEVMRAQMSRAEKLMAASSPALQQQGEELYAQVMTAQREYEERQETQRIQAEVAQEAAERAYGTQNFTRYQGLYGNLQQESSDFIAKRDAYGALMSAYSDVEEPGNFNDIAAINSFQRIIDPGVSVREGDVSVLQNWAGMPDALLTAVNRVVRDGGRFAPEERAELVQLGNQLMSDANSQQVDRNARFQATADAFDLPQELIQQMRIPITDIGNTQELGFGTPQPSATPAPTEEEAGRLVPVDKFFESIAMRLLPTAEDTGALPPDVQDSVDQLEDAGRVAISDTGRVFLHSTFGNIQELTTTQAQREQIIDIRNNGISEQMLEEIRQRRSDRLSGGSVSGRIMRVGPMRRVNGRRVENP